MSGEIVKTDRELTSGKSDELERVLEDKPASARPDVLAIAESFRRCEHVLLHGWRCTLQKGHDGRHEAVHPENAIGKVVNSNDEVIGQTIGAATAAQIVAVSGVMASEIMMTSFGEVVGVKRDPALARLKNKDWVCAKCDYMNVSSICTKCGSAIPKYLTAEQLREMAASIVRAAGETFDEFKEEKSRRRREATLVETPSRCNFWMLGERCGCLAGHEGPHGSPEGWAEVQRALKSGSFAFRETLDKYVERKK